MPFEFRVKRRNVKVIRVDAKTHQYILVESRAEGVTMTHFVQTVMQEHAARKYKLNPAKAKHSHNATFDNDGKI